MADPLRTFFDWPGHRGRRPIQGANAAQIVRQDPMMQAEQLISRHELRVWFEPNWNLACRLAARFPHCLICSIPTESDTPAFRKTPGWRPRRVNGVV